MNRRGGWPQLLEALAVLPLLLQGAKDGAQRGLAACLGQQRRRTFADDRGDVPGWVLVTVMTAGLVTALWLVADGQLTSVLGNAIKSVTKP